MKDFTTVKAHNKKRSINLTSGKIKRMAFPEISHFQKGIQNFNQPGVDAILESLGPVPLDIVKRWHS